MGIHEKSVFVGSQLHKRLVLVACSDSKGRGMEASRRAKQCVDQLALSQALYLLLLSNVH